VYAIISNGGHQVKVESGSVVAVDRRDGQPGDKVTFDQVLLVGQDGGEVLMGAPHIEGARVVGVIEALTRGPKIRVFHKKRRKGFRKTQGHRTDLTRVRITDIIV
jgi:large subunit ribosomal protein L21